MWIRNPYKRLLAGFLDTAVNPGSKFWERAIKLHGGPYRDTPEEFARFIGNLMAMRENGDSISAQFTPLVEHCGLDKGMQYDLYLRAEQMEDWYADLVSLLGLEDFVRAGWQVYTVRAGILGFEYRCTGGETAFLPP